MPNPTVSIDKVLQGSGSVELSELQLKKKARLTVSIKTINKTSL